MRRAQARAANRRGCKTIIAPSPASPASRMAGALAWSCPPRSAPEAPPPRPRAGLRPVAARADRSAGEDAAWIQSSYHRSGRSGQSRVCATAWNKQCELPGETLLLRSSGTPDGAEVLLPSRFSWLLDWRRGIMGGALPGKGNLMKRREFLGALGAAAALNAAAGPAPPQAEPVAGKTFVSPREDGRFVETAGFLHQYLQNAPSAAGVSAGHAPRAICSLAGAGAGEAVGADVFSGSTRATRAQADLVAAREGYRLERWEAYPEPYCVVPYLLLVPHGISPQSPAPGVLCFPGSTGSKESLAGEPVPPVRRSRTRPSGTTTGWPTTMRGGEWSPWRGQPRDQRAGRHLAGLRCRSVRGSLAAAQHLIDERHLDGPLVRIGLRVPEGLPVGVARAPAVRRRETRGHQRPFARRQAGRHPGGALPEPRARSGAQRLCLQLAGARGGPES